MAVMHASLRWMWARLFVSRSGVLNPDPGKRAMPESDINVQQDGSGGVAVRHKQILPEQLYRQPVLQYSVN